MNFSKDGGGSVNLAVLFYTSMEILTSSDAVRVKTQTSEVAEK